MKDVPGFQTTVVEHRQKEILGSDGPVILHSNSQTQRKPIKGCVPDCTYQSLGPQISKAVKYIPLI